MADDLTKSCDGSDDPAHRCGLHHSTGLANPFGGYECCCGDAWKTRADECMTGAKRGTPVTLRERMRRAAWAEDRTVDGNTLDAYMTVVAPELERLAEERDAARLVSKGRTMGQYDQEAELERLRKERDDNWAYFQRVCKASGIAEAQMDLMAQMRNSERQRADDLLAERDALKAAIEDAENCWPDPFGNWTAEQADAARAMKSIILTRLAALDTPTPTEETATLNSALTVRPTEETGDTP